METGTVNPHTTVALVDDQQLVRAGFCLVLESQENISVSWQAENGQQACALAMQQPVDIIFMDVQMPVMDGITATRTIIDAAPIGPAGNPTKIVVLTTFDNDSYILGSVEAGASGFLLKDAEPEDLFAAVRTVGDSAAVISPRATAKLLHHIRNTPTASTQDRPTLPKYPAPQPLQASTPPSAPPESSVNSCPDEHLGLAEPLTPRELEILQLMAQGKSNQEIAKQLYISLPTVKTHVGRVLLKTNSRDRVHAVLFAFHHGLVNPQGHP